MNIKIVNFYCVFILWFFNSLNLFSSFNHQDECIYFQNNQKNQNLQSCNIESYSNFLYKIKEIVYGKSQHLKSFFKENNNILELFKIVNNNSHNKKILFFSRSEKQFTIDNIIGNILCIMYGKNTYKIKFIDQQGTIINFDDLSGEYFIQYYDKEKKFKLYDSNGNIFIPSWEYCEEKEIKKNHSKIKKILYDENLLNKKVFCMKIGNQDFGIHIYLPKSLNYDVLCDFSNKKHKTAVSFFVWINQKQYEFLVSKEKIIKNKSVSYIFEKDKLYLITSIDNQSMSYDWRRKVICMENQEKEEQEKNTLDEKKILNPITFKTYFTLLQQSKDKKVILLKAKKNLKSKLKFSEKIIQNQKNNSIQIKKNVEDIFLKLYDTNTEDIFFSN
jgi:hypothetical protein